MKAIFLFTLASVSTLVLNAQNIFINEVMAANESAIADAEGDYPDWIELYNDEMFAVDLEGFYLSDDEDEIDKWTFPQMTIPAKGFLVVFASDKGKIINGELHTNFKVSSSGEVLLLSNSSKTKIDQVITEKMEEDQSYGRLPDGAPSFVPLPEFSPSVSNNAFDYILSLIHI